MTAGLLPPALRWRVGLVVLGGAGVLTAALAAVVGQPIPEPGWVLVALVAFGIADVRLVTVRYGSQRVALHMVELAGAVSLVLLPGWAAILTAAAAAATGQTLRRKPPVKALFNTAQTVLGISLAWLVAHPVPHLLSDHADVAAVVRLGLGCLAFSAMTTVLTSAVISGAQGAPMWPVLRDAAPFHLLTGAANSVCAAGILALAQWAPQTLIVVPPLLLALYLTYSLYLRTVAERDTWQELERAGADMTALSVADVASSAVRHAVGLFGSDGAEMSVAASAPDAGPTSWRTGSGGDVVSDARAGSWLAGTSFLPRPGEAASTTVALDDGDGTSRSAVVCDLLGPRGLVGHLVLFFAGPVRLTIRERSVLTTYTRTVAAALERAWLHEEVREQAERKAYEAAHDGLTGLANRGLLQERVRGALREAAATGRLAGLLLLDLDHFKTVNDTLGHSTGDRLLRLVAARLRTVAGAGDTVARLGGDEFALLLPGLGDPAAAERAAAEVQRVLAEPIDCDGLRLAVGGSIGIACWPVDADGAEELFQRADVALYQAKESRGTSRRYLPAADSSSVSRLELVAELPHALDQDQVILYYQPQVDCALGTLVGVEALARWNHPTRGLLLPADFITAVEHSGLLRAFTLRVLDTAVGDCAAWAREGRALTVAINLSARNLLDPALVADVADVLARHRLPAQALVLEITETSMVGELPVVEDVLSGLHSLGVQLSVDDFGTGYSSLSFLRRVRVDELKVDRSFVRGMLDDEGDAALVRATVDLARSFGLRVVAEGVESAPLLAALDGLGCDVAQGWYVGRPTDLATTRELLGLPTRGASAPPMPSRLPVARLGSSLISLR